MARAGQALIGSALLVSLFGSGETRADDAAAQPSTVYVHVETMSAAKLMRKDNDTGEWVLVCDSPCDQRVARGAFYRMVAVEDGSSSGDFRFRRAHGDSVVATFSPASKSQRAGGAALIVTGTAALIGGIITFAVGVGNTDEPWGGYAALTGGIMVLASIPFGIAGAVLFDAGGASVKVEPSSPPATSAAPPPAVAPALVVPLGFRF